MTRWFRYYDDALNDPKVQSLPGDLFKTWVNLLSVASKYDGQLPSIYELTYLLRRRSDRVEADLNKLVEHGLIDLIDDHFEPHNWRKRQYKSDSSNERVKRHREARCNVTPTVTVTPPETETETETEQNRTEQKDSLSDKRSDRKRKRISYSEEFEEFWKGYPPGPNHGKSEAWDEFKKLEPDDRRKSILSLPAFRAYCAENRDYTVIHPNRYLKKRRFDGFAPSSTDPPVSDEYMAAKGYVWKENKWQKMEAA